MGIVNVGRSYSQQSTRLVAFGGLLGLAFIFALNSCSASSEPDSSDPPGTGLQAGASASGGAAGEGGLGGGIGVGGFGGSAMGGNGGVGGFGTAGSGGFGTAGSGGFGTAGSGGANPCAPTSASVPHYVDINLGTDDGQHGAAPGNCALKSIPYALSVATGEIHVSADTYPITATIELGGSQHLVCAPGGGTTISGQPLFGSTHMIIKVVGSASVSHCNLQGQSIAPGYCIEAFSSNNSVFDRLSLTGCAGAAIRAGENITVTNCDFAHGNVNVFFQTAFNGHISGNQFSAPAPVFDVKCNLSGGTITGSGNTDTGDPSGVTCSTECNCPANFDL